MIRSRPQRTPAAGCRRSQADAFVRRSLQNVIGGILSQGVAFIAVTALFDLGVPKAQSHVIIQIIQIALVLENGSTWIMITEYR